MRFAFCHPLFFFRFCLFFFSLFQIYCQIATTTRSKPLPEETGIKSCTHKNLFLKKKKKKKKKAKTTGPHRLSKRVWLRFIASTSEETILEEPEEEINGYIVLNGYSKIWDPTVDIDPAVAAQQLPPVLDQRESRFR